MSKSTEKSKSLELMKKTFEDMLAKIKEELHSLDVEWLHLRSLALQIPERINAPETQPSDPKTNFDDASEINSQVFNCKSMDDIFKRDGPDNESSDDD